MRRNILFMMMVGLGISFSAQAGVPLSSLQSGGLVLTNLGDVNFYFQGTGDATTGGVIGGGMRDVATMGHGARSHGWGHRGWGHRGWGHRGWGHGGTIRGGMGSFIVGGTVLVVNGDLVVSIPGGNLPVSAQ